MSNIRLYFFVFLKQKIMKKTTLLLSILLSFSLYSQSGYEVAKELSSKNIDSLRLDINNLLQYRTRLTKQTVEQLENLKFFIDNPFSNKIDFKKLKISKTIAIAEKDSVSNKDIDGDGVLDTFDKCATPSSIFNFGCPDDDESKKSFYNVLSDSKGVLKSNVNETAFSPLNSPFTKTVDAFSKFLVDRTKKEIALTFFENFSSKLKKDITFKVKGKNNKDIFVSLKLSDLFPSTNTMLVSIDGFSLPSFGETWIVAFKKDLQELPNNISKALQNSDNFSTTELGYYTLSLFSIIDNLIKGNHPSDIISNFLENNPLWKGKSKNNIVFNSLKTIDLFSKNLIEVGKNKKRWISTSAFDSLSNEGKKFLLGWIYQEGRNKKIFTKPNLYNSYQKIESQYKYITNQISEIEDEINKLNKIIDKDSKAYISSFGDFVDKSINLIISVVENTSIKNKRVTSDGAFLISKIKLLTIDIKNLTLNIKDKSYGESLFNILSLLKNITKMDDNNALVKSVSFYGNFLVDLVNASKLKDSENIELILNKYALPVSSYRIKRKKNYSIDLASYPGISGGYEFSDSNSGSFGITAPIGFSFSLKNNTKKPSSTSSSLFLSIIDIGAPFSYRLTNDDAEGLPENITLEQIFAPGLFYVYGFNNSPFSLSFGAQYSPLLRKIKVNNVLDDQNIFKLSISFVVDIPIFNLLKAR